jgi:Flp pilus assembly protein TadD
MGVVLHEKGHLDEAAEHWKEAVRIRPDNGDAWYLLANSLKRQERYDEAESAYRNAVSFMTLKHTALVNLGNMYAERNRVEEAIAAYRAAVEHVESDPARMFSPRPYLALGIALRRNGEPDEARTFLEQASRYPETRAAATQELELLR